MSLQVHVWRPAGSLSATLTQYVPPINGQRWDTTEARALVVCTAVGTFSHWSIVLSAAPGSGKSFTFTLRINGVDTAAVITISDTATSGTFMGSVALADGDELTLKCVPSGTPTASTASVCWDFTSATAGESIYGLASGTATINANRTGRVLGAYDTSTWEASTTVDVVGCAGAITKATIKLDTDVTAAGSLTFTMTKNGVDQNGTAGTPDTRITFATGTTKTSASFTLPVVPGDVLTWKAVRTGTPATVRPATGVRVLATTPGESHFGAVILGPFSTTAAAYFSPGQGSGNPGAATEAPAAVTLGPTGFTLHNLRAGLTGATGAGLGYTFTLRQNEASTAHAVSIVGAASGSTTASTVFAPGDRVALQVMPVSTPPPRGGGWAWTQEAVATVTAVERAELFIIQPV